MAVVFRFLQSLIQAKALPGAWNPPPTAPGPLTAGAGGQQERASPAEGLLPGPTLSLSLPAPSALICPRPDTETPTSSAGPNRAARGCPSLRAEEVTHGRKQKGALGPSGGGSLGHSECFQAGGLTKLWSGAFRQRHGTGRKNTRKLQNFASTTGDTGKKLQSRVLYKQTSLDFCVIAALRG